MSGPLRPDICTTVPPSVANVWLDWNVQFSIFYCFLPNPWTPPNWLSGFHTPTTTNPHLHLACNPAPKPPQEAAAQMNSLLCVQNTWHPPTPKRESFDLWSIWVQTHRALPQRPHNNRYVLHTSNPPRPHTHTCREPPYQHLNSIILVYPWSHAHPNPPLSPQQWTCLTSKNTACQTMACPIGWNYGNKLGIGG